MSTKRSDEMNKLLAEIYGHRHVAVVIPVIPVNPESERLADELMAEATKDRAERRLNAPALEAARKLADAVEAFAESPILLGALRAFREADR